ncbi:glycosyltransferase [Candidatus Wolfebacteria bacterium]|nr:glycosyltransferase [Candidatus Wolfebacteria bacterium]
MSNNKKISCSVGVLTYNVANELPRLLEGLKDFDEIIITDGGSTDGTLEIAKEYGCKVVSQSNPGNPIEDFAKERNISLDAAKHDWFFYIDSDEVISKELVNRIRSIVEDNKESFLIYKVRYVKTSPDLSIKYRTFKEYYQTRFFNKKSGARFKKKIHEKIFFDKTILVGIINEPWYVLLEEELDFKEYKKKVVYRVDVMVKAQKQTLKRFLMRGVYSPSVESLKTFIKMVYVRLRFRKKGIPAQYELNRLYLQWVTFKTYCKYFFDKDLAS